MQALALTTILALSTAPAGYGRPGCEPPAVQEPESPEDPRATFLRRLEASMRRHPFFSQVDCTRIDDYPPFVLYVQSPHKQQANYQNLVGQFYGPWLSAFEKLFRADYVERHELEKSVRLPVYPLVVLASHGDYINYSNAVSSYDLYAARAHYEPELKLAVTFREPFKVHTADHQERRPALHELVHMFQHAYYEPSGLPELPTWYGEGLAEYLSYHVGTGTSYAEKRLAEHRIDPQALRLVGGLLREPQLKVLCLHPLPDLIAIGSYSEVIERAVARARKARLALPDQNLLMQVFYAQSSLFVHFLHHAEEGRWRAGFGRFTQSVLSGQDGESAFEQVFGDGLQELEGAFEDYLRRSFEAEYGVSATAPATDPALQPELPPQPDPVFDPAALALSAHEVEAQLGRVLLDVLAGRARAALERLEGIEPKEATQLQRVELERSRLSAWIELREALLQALQDSGRELKLDYGGLSLKARITGREGDDLLLGENAHGLERVAIASLPAIELAKLMKDLRELEVGWARLYPYVLSDHKLRTKLMRKDRREELESLRRDAESFYPRVLQAGRAAGLLSELAGLEGVTDKAQAEAVLRDIGDLLGQYGELELVAGRKSALQPLAAQALAASFELQDLSELVRVPIERLGAERVRLTYDFDDLRQIDDFVEEANYLDYNHEALGAISIAKQRQGLKAVAGKLVGRGATCYRHVLEFSAPLVVRYEIQWRPDEQIDTQIGEFVLGVCGTEYGDSIQVWPRGDVQVFDEKARFVEQGRAQGQQMSIAGKTYKWELRHDGESVSSFKNGQQLARAACGPRQSGWVFLWLHSDGEVVLHRLEIEADLKGAGLEALRRSWTEARLAAIGLGG